MTDRRGAGASCARPASTRSPAAAPRSSPPRVRKKICDDKCTRRRVAGGPPHRPPDGPALELHDALRPHRDRRGARRPPAAPARAAGRDRRLPDLHPAGLPPRQQRADEAARRRPASRTCAPTRSRACMLDNIPHIKAYWVMLGVKTAQTALWFGADDLDGTVQEEKHLSHGRRRDAAGDDARPRSSASSASRAARRSSATRSTTSSPRARRWRPTSRSGATCAAAWRSCRERREDAASPPSRS